LKIFLGSSREAVETGLLRRVASWVEAARHEPVRWDDPGVFPPGAYTFTTLRQVARQVDGAIFIFSEDDELWYRTDKVTQPRDNVLIEYGLFAAALGEGSVIFCRVGKPRTATDLSGITYVDVSAETLVRAEISVTDWLGRLQTSNPGSLLLERLSSPFQASGKESLFLKGTELVRKASRRVALVAKTPIILIGPRPYDGSDSPISYEANQLSSYQTLMNKSSNGSLPDFICVASSISVLEELAQYRHASLAEKMHKNYTQLQAACSKPGSHMRIRWYEGTAPMTFLVSDDDFMIWFKDRSGESVWITAHNEVIARALYAHADSIAKERSLEDVLRDFAKFS
jgi:hypothetical protein